MRHKTSVVYLKMTYYSCPWQEGLGVNELLTGKRISTCPGLWNDCFGFIVGVLIDLECPGKQALNMTSGAPGGVFESSRMPLATCINPLTQAPNAINTAPEYVSPA